MNLYRMSTAEPYTFLVIDITLTQIIIYPSRYEIFLRDLDQISIVRDISDIS